MDPILDRVEETPEGYIVLEEEGQEIKLEANETLATYLAVEPDELRNVFVVRDADLRIGSEDVFYKRVTDKITGLRLEDIRKIKEQLRDMGKLTSGLKISNRASHFKAKSQLESAGTLKDEVKKYIERAETEGMLNLEADIFEVNTQEVQLKSRLELLEKAKKNDEFKELNKVLESAQGILSELNSIPEENLRSLRERLTLYDASENKLPHFHRSKDFFKKLSYLFLIGSFVTFIGLQFFEEIMTFDWIIPVILIILTIISILQSYKMSQSLSQIEVNQTSILREATTISSEVQDISNLRRTLEGLDVKVKQLRDSLNQKLGVLKKDLNIELDAPNKILAKSSEKLEAFRGEIDLTVDISYNQEDFEQTQQELNEMGGKKKILGESLETHLRNLEDFAKRAYKLNFLTFLNRELDLEIKNLDSLKQLTPQLDELQRKINEDVKMAIDSLKLFDLLEEEEKAKVTVLFQKGNLASQLFNKITNGKYSEVEYDYENEKIIVCRPTGEKFPVEKLSRGARDQLYLSIRVALGQMLLEGKSGFFIMDDAFISSDDERIKQQTDLLKDLSEIGWQTIYFSAKNETIGFLSHTTKNKAIRLKPFP